MKKIFMLVMAFLIVGCKNVQIPNDYDEFFIIDSKTNKSFHIARNYRWDF